MIVAAPAAQAKGGATQISGVAVADAGDCPDPPEGFEDYVFLTLAMSGDLEGCWYTLVESFKDNGPPSGVYQERGREVFVADDGSMFETTYKFTSKWDPQFITGEDPLTFGVELHGRCQHPIVEGSGTGTFENTTGRVDFKDDVDTGEFFYRGHIKGLNGS